MSGRHPIRKQHQPEETGLAVFTLVTVSNDALKLGQSRTETGSTDIQVRVGVLGFAVML